MFKKEILDYSEALEVIHPVISKRDNIAFTKPVTMEEVKSVVFGMGPYKAPSPDGYLGIFYHKFWDTIKDDVFRMVQNFFHHGLLPQNIKHTNIVLIPKQKCSERLR